MQSKTLTCLGAHGFHRLAYYEWGDPGNPRVLVCVHGLTRNGRDFDFLAAALDDDYRVICPDVVGRGRSDALADAKEYGYRRYCADMAALVARAGADEVDWLGTSMGGLIGILMAGEPGSPIRRLLVNDIGPIVPQAGVDRLLRYVGRDLTLGDLAEVERYLRQIYAPFGPLADEHWRHLAVHSAVDDGAGRLRLAYDLGIAEPLKAAGDTPADQWESWDRIRCPVLVLRGAQSDILPAAVAEAMQQRGPRAELVEFDGIGHAPALMAADQIDAVRTWLLR